MCTDKRKKNKKNPITIDISSTLIPSKLSYDSSSDSSYYTPTSNHKTKNLYIYYEHEKMPENGWMQSCFKCELFTAKTLIYREEENKTYIVYVCNNCKKTLTNRENNFRFRRRCEKFIKRYLD